jgi:hypothetical protein
VWDFRLPDLWSRQWKRGFPHDTSSRADGETATRVAPTPDAANADEHLGVGDQMMVARLKSLRRQVAELGNPQLLEEAVSEARDYGMSWRIIACSTGRTEDAVRQRWGW